MGLWDKVQKELDRAGSVARDALDEGKIRIELFRVRQQADKAAQALGYAVRRARRESREVDPETLGRLDAALAEHEATAKQLEADLARALRKDAPDGSAGGATGDTSAGASHAEASPQPPADPPTDPPDGGSSKP